MRTSRPSSQQRQGAAPPAPRWHGGAAAAVVAGYVLAVLLTGAGQGLRTLSHLAESQRHVSVEAPTLLPESTVHYLPGMTALRPNQDGDDRLERVRSEKPREQSGLIAWWPAEVERETHHESVRGSNTRGDALRPQRTSDLPPALVLRVEVDHHGAPAPPAVPPPAVQPSGERGEWRDVPASRVQPVETPPPLARG